MTSFERRREATIQFSDVFGDLPVSARKPGIPDFDAVLTAQVRNTGRFSDAYFPIGDWPALGDYAAVLIEQLRADQLSSHQNINAKTHPDEAALAASLGAAVVAIVNCAPRRADHHQEGENGDAFFVGLTAGGAEVFAQLPYLRGLHARGQLRELYMIPNDSGVWAPGEQFRSSCVTQARRSPEILEPVGLDESCPIPALELDGRVAYADKFGNIRLEVKNIQALQDVLSPDNKVVLDIDGMAQLTDVLAVKQLTDIPEGKLGIYRNPADNHGDEGVAYLELVRRVSNPNNSASHAYASLVQQIADDPTSFNPAEWENINITIEAE